MLVEQPLTTQLTVIILDFLTWLQNLLPSPWFEIGLAVILAVLFFGSIFLCVLLQVSPLTSFLFLDLETMIERLSKPKPRGKISRSYRTDPENRRLQADLLVLLKGDVATAKRLLLQQRRLNPGMSDNWYLEKVIYDLERDRR